MSTSGEAADQVIKIVLDGVQMLLRVSGDQAERLHRMLTLALKDSNKPSKGKASLKKMLKSNSPVKVFEIKDRDLKKFCEEAKKYGVMYHILKDKNSNNGKCDIMVREEDAAKVNRIFERFNLGANNKSVIRKAVEKSQQDGKQVPMKTQPGKTPDDRFIEELFKSPSNKEKSFNENPSVAKTEKSRPSEPTSEDRKKPMSHSRDYNKDASSRKSVRAQLKEIKDEQKKARSEAQQIKTPKKQKTKKRGAKDNVRT